MLEKIRNAKFFSVIDLKNGYFNIPIKEQDRYKTAFVLPWTKLQWKRLTQGLIGAPFTFAEVIVFVFQDLNAFVITYFDDILIFSKDEESHVKHVEIVLDRLIKHNLAINEEKSQWTKTNVNFLGHSISQDGLRPTAVKITDIVNFTEPKSVDQVRSFLGICSFYRKFIPKFAQEAEPLYSLLHKRSTFEWMEEWRDAFKCIKNKLVEAELLH